MARQEQNKNHSPAASVFASEIEGFTAHSRLSRRESDIVLSLIRNVTNSEDIANSLGISTHTVNNHLKSIFEKTSTKSKTEILSTFLRFAADRLQGRSLFVRKPRVLVIDDEAMICEYINSGLSDRGVRVFSLTDPTKAVETISKLNVDFVICDLRMPTMSGMEVLRKVREVYKCWPYFIFVTGYPDHTLEECMHYGACGFIEKPLDLDKLFRSMMEYLVESPEERKELMQVEGASPVAIDQTFALSHRDLGFGGAFLPMEANDQKKAKVNVGTLVDMRLRVDGLNDGEPMKARGQIVWKRAAKEGELRAGIGVKFVSMGDKDQAAFEDLIRSRDISSFVPRGA
jgi:DNA-binding NarL/FixJ family response regulator